MIASTAFAMSGISRATAGATSRSAALITSNMFSVDKPSISAEEGLGASVDRSELMRQIRKAGGAPGSLGLTEEYSCVRVMR